MSKTKFTEKFKVMKDRKVPTKTTQLEDKMERIAIIMFVVVVRVVVVVAGRVPVARARCGRTLVLHVVKPPRTRRACFDVASPRRPCAMQSVRRKN